MVMGLLAMCAVGLALVVAGDRWRVPFFTDMGAVLTLGSILAIPVGALMFPGWL